MGLVKASFTVIENIPQELKVGVFKTAKTFKSWIRISNASDQIQSDAKGGVKGLAIKLLGITGERVDSDELNTQDFLFLSIPTFPLGTIKLFRDVIYYSTKLHPLLLALKLILSGKKELLKSFKKGIRKDTSPLDIDYWSTTPSMHGEQKLKYKLTPTSKIKSELPPVLSDNYLTDNMQNHLNKGIATFDFYVQLFRDEKSTPIEDAGVEWKEEISPFVKVAEMEIPKQEFNTSERFEMAEHFSFSPANSLMAHRPIGGINRARMIIYKSLSEFRHKRDNIALSEPDLSEYDSIG